MNFVPNYLRGTWANLLQLARTGLNSALNFIRAGFLQKEICMFSQPFVERRGKNRVIWLSLVFFKTKLVPLKVWRWLTNQIDVASFKLVSLLGNGYFSFSKLKGSFGNFHETYIPLQNSTKLNVTFLLQKLHPSILDQCFFFYLQYCMEPY